MGLLDSITSAIGEGTKDLQNQAIGSMLQNFLKDKNIDISHLIQNIDMSKAGELVDFFKKNGVPDTKEEIEELISKFKK